MRRLDTICAWGIFVIGFVHISGLLLFFEFLVRSGTVGVDREPVLWWFSGGMTFWFGAALNLLRISYRSEAPATVPIAVAANVIMLLFEIWLELNNPDFLFELRTLLLIFVLVLSAFSISDLVRLSRGSQAAA